MPSASELERMEQESASAGHNSGAALRSFIERIERLEEEKKGIADDIKDVYGEAKATGFDAKAMRKMVALRKMDPATRQERLSIEELYMDALGLL